VLIFDILQPSVSRTTLLFPLIPAVNCWAILSRPLSGLVELIFVQNAGATDNTSLATDLEALTEQVRHLDEEDAAVAT
jgi:hypothetical protein